MPKIKGVIFDWGGVLIDDPEPVLIAFCSNALGVPKDAFKEAKSLFSAEFQKGKITESQFWIGICSNLNVTTPKSKSLWFEAFKHADSPKKDVLALVPSLRENGYKTAMLSNAEIPAVKYFSQKEYVSFDVAVFSCFEGTSKPEHRIYELALERLNLQADEVLFVDDNPEYIMGANQVGLNTILFEDFQQLKGRLGYFSVQID